MIRFDSLRKLSCLLNKYYSCICISKNKTMNLQKCYFRYIQNEDKIDITFLLRVKETVRQFNFSRKPIETLEALSSRISTNVQKAFSKSSKKKHSNTNAVEVKVYDSLDNEVSSSLICKELFSITGTLKLKIADQMLELEFNSPWITNLNLPQSILAGFPVYPENLTSYYTDKSKSVFNWHSGQPLNENGREISSSHIIWKHVGSGFIYTPSAEDIGRKLKLECIPGNESCIGPAFEVISKNVVEAGPGPCPFEIRHGFTSQKLQGKIFRCITYNILADLYCDSDYTRTTLHPYCPPYALHIDYRKQMIIKELLGYNADIICLQEVDKKVFNSHLSPILDVEGMDGLFYKKGKEVAEGLACFYRRERFSVLESETIVLSEALQKLQCLQPIWENVKTNEKLIDRLLDRSTVASYTLLKSRDNPEELIIVGNTHLYFHPDADHIRLIQGGIVVYWLRDIKEKLKQKYPNNRISVILCGDFNSVPSCGIYQLYTMGVADSSLPDWESNKEQVVRNLALKQDIALASACGTPQYTNFTAGFADCLDYIFYEKSNLTVEQVVPLPSIEDLQANTALPSIVFPSDHVALISDLRFI